MNKNEYAILNGSFNEKGVGDLDIVAVAFSLKRAKEIARDLIKDDKKIKRGFTDSLFNKKYKNYTFVTAITSNSNPTEYIFYKEI